MYILGDLKFWTKNSLFLKVYDAAHIYLLKESTMYKAQPKSTNHTATASQAQTATENPGLSEFNQKSHVSDLPLKRYMSTDLHGLSAKEAKLSIERTLRESENKRVDELTVITGRGNHVNKNGTRAVLFNAFPEWLKAQEATSNIKKVEKNIGSYKLHFQPQTAASDNIMTLDSLNAMLMDSIKKEGINSVKEKAAKGDLALLGMLGFLYLTGCDVLPQNRQEGLKLIRSAAKQGDPIAMMTLAGLHQTGKQGVRKDPKKAFKLLQRVAAQKNLQAIEAQHRIAICYFLGQGVPQDDKKAIEAFKIAAHAGHPHAQLNLGNIYAEGVATDKHDTIANQYYEQAANQNILDAQIKLAKRYLKGEGEQSDLKAFQWFQKAALLGDPESQCQVAEAYSKGRGVKADQMQAYFWYHKAAAKGYAEAQYQLGVVLHEGQGCKKDIKQSIEWFNLAIQQKNAEALLAMSYMYLTGNEIIKIDRKKSLACIEEAAELGSGIARKKLLMHYGTSDEPAKHKKASEWLKELVLMKDAEAQFMMANMLEEADKSRKEIRDCIFSLYQQSAEQNFAEAQLRLGECYLNGDYTKEDPTLAVKWLKSAAQLGNAKAQNYLGTFHSHGDYGLEKNDNTAYEWYLKAAIQDDAMAQMNLAETLMFGTLSHPNKYQDAKTWLERSIKLGNPEARFKLLILENLMNKNPAQSKEPVAKEPSNPILSAFQNTEKLKIQDILKRYQIAKESQLPPVETSLRRATAMGNKEDVVNLSKIVKDINAQDKNPKIKRTALHWAAVKKHADVYDFLISIGANPNIRDAQEKTAEDYRKAILKNNQFH